MPVSIRPPVLRPGTVARTALVSRLLRDEAAVVVLVAGPGYGKTTLLAQWAAAETRPVAWLSIDVRDNDPLVFLKHVVAAVDRVQPLDRRMLTSLGRTRSATPAWVVDRAVRALTCCRRPFLLVLDDAHLVEASAARRLLALLIAEAPAGSTVALAGRTAPSLAASALAAKGKPSRLCTGDLALGKREAQLVCRAAAAGADEQEISALIELCEGWATALRLAALSLRDAPSREATARLAQSDRYLAEYIRTEYLSRLDPRDVRFLRRTAILGELAGPLCDAVLQERGSTALLARLARTDAPLVPLEPPGRYRCRRLVRELLLRELHTEEPHLVALLHRRAAAAYEQAGDLRAALAHARSAGDAGRVARVVGAVALRVSWQSRMPELEAALAEFEATRPLARSPQLAVHGGWIHAFAGRCAEADRWLAVAQRCARDGAAPPRLRERVAVLRAALCRTGARRMLADAGSALGGLTRADPWYAAGLHMQGTAALMLDADEADGILTAATRTADALGCVETQLIAAAQLSLLAREHGDNERADELSTDALRLGHDAELERRPSYALALAAAAACALRHGRWADAREVITAAEPLSASLGIAVPWLAAAARSELARCYLTLHDEEAAREALAELDTILEARPRLGKLAVGVAELHRELEQLTRPRAAVAGLTPAELRLLPLLGSYLSFREIAERLTVSRNTVKTQAISIYRKLGVSGRSEAMAAAADLRLPRAA